MIESIKSALAKVPHLLFLALAAFGGGALVYLQAEPTTGLVAALQSAAGLEALARAAAVAGAIAVVSLLKPAPSSSSPTPPAARRVPPLACLAFLALAGAAACSGGCAPGVAVVAPAIDTVVCILTTVSAEPKGTAWAKAVADAVASCGTDAATVATVWGSHDAAEVREGLTPTLPVPPPVDAGGQ